MERWCCVWRELVERKDVFEALLEVDLEGTIVAFLFFQANFFQDL
jgi:hypothetical protein